MNYRRNEDKWPYYDGPINYNMEVGKIVDETGTDEPVTLAEAKLHLRVSHTDDDEYITMLIKAARLAVENFTRLSLVPKNISVDIQNTKEGFELPYGPITSMIRATNSDDVDLTTEEITYTDGDFPQVKYDSFSFYDGPLKFTYFAGYSPETIPADLKLAVLEQVAWKYEHRGDEALFSPIAKTYAKAYKRTSWLL